MKKATLFLAFIMIQGLLILSAIITAWTLKLVADYLKIDVLLLAVCFLIADKMAHIIKDIQ